VLVSFHIASAAVRRILIFIATLTAQQLIFSSRAKAGNYYIFYFDFCFARQCAAKALFYVNAYCYTRAVKPRS
jgi:hypothetical protein